MKSFYVATTFSNHEFAHEVVKALEMREGWKCSYDWTRDLISYNDPPHIARPQALKDLRGAFEADVLIVLQPGKNGTHTEMGAAIAARWFMEQHHQRIIMFEGGPKVECIFYHLVDFLVPNGDGYEAEEVAQIVTEFVL